ncbi:MAG: TetR/AcrR family transcriptional regulator [Reichenbachiella sp.]|uniref:TetR/AcrR family transcriptional regulator n=1 Tax=Reichenbachiella sp. TaxID=2184521 RepID=UPI003264AB7B
MTKKEKIMEAAIRLFCSLGFQNTSTTKITKEAGVGTGTLFLYFKSKDQLVNDLYLEIKKEMQVYHHVFSNSNLAFKDQLNTFWVEVVHWGLANPDKFKFLMQFKNSPYLTRITMDEVSEDHKFVAEVMQKAIADGLIINQPFEFLMALFTSQFLSIIQYLTLQNNDQQEALIQTSFEILWNGIKKN